jgi:hypothetical protein
MATLSQCEYFKPGSPGQDKPDEAVLDRRPRPKIASLLITGIIVSAVWAGIIVFSYIKRHLVIDRALILTLAAGIPAGTAAFTFLRLLKNPINRAVTFVGKNAGGNLLGWIVSTLLPFASPVIVFINLAGVFGTKIMWK